MATPAPAKRGKKPRAAAPAASAATGQVQSLTRGLKLLEYVSEAQGNVALTDLAQQAGLPNSTTHRLLTTTASWRRRASSTARCGAAGSSRLHV